MEATQGTHTTNVVEIGIGTAAAPMAAMVPSASGSQQSARRVRVAADTLADNGAVADRMPRPGSKTASDAASVGAPLPAGRAGASGSAISARRSAEQCDGAMLGDKLAKDREPVSADRGEYCERRPCRSAARSHAELLPPHISSNASAALSSEPASRAALHHRGSVRARLGHFSDQVQTRDGKLFKARPRTSDSAHLYRHALERVPASHQAMLPYRRRRLPDLCRVGRCRVETVRCADR